MLVNGSPNFYMEAVNLMDDYFQWARKSKEEEDQIRPWEDAHLVDHAENFTMSSSEIDTLYNDVYQFLFKM